jgi:hypothetical protein
MGDDTYKIDLSRYFPFNDDNFFLGALAATNEISGVAGSGLDFVHTYPQPVILPTKSTSIMPDDNTWIADYWEDSCNTTQCWNWPATGCPTGKECVLAWTFSLVNGDDMYRSLIDVNDDDHIPWFEGSGTPGDTKYDLRGTMVHELGHASGFGHINVNCGTSSMYSMCGDPSDFLGNLWGRTLSSHEENDLAAKY